MRISRTILKDLGGFHDNINKLKKSYEILALTREHEKVIRSFILFRERIGQAAPEEAFPSSFWHILTAAYRLDTLVNLLGLKGLVFIVVRLPQT